MPKTTKAELEEKIKDLENLIGEQRNWLSESEKKYRTLLEEKEQQFKSLPLYQQMENEIKKLQSFKKLNEDSLEYYKKTEYDLRNRIQNLLEENKQLKESIKNQNIINDTKHNAKNAGRKPKSAEQLEQQVQQLNQLLQAEKTEEEICTRMQISRSTYYRLKKTLKYQ